MGRSATWTLSAVLVILLLSACAGGTPSGESGVQGQIQVGPTCPVVAPGDDCADRPFQGGLSVLDGRGKVVAKGASDAQGNYRIALNPGEYTLMPASPREDGVPLAQPVQFSVQQGEWTELDVTYDTGIR